MQQDQQQPGDVQETDDEQFEIRPWVKYAAIGFGLAVLVAVEVATYRVGYDRGYGDATASGEVRERVNAVAVENLHHFMQVASMPDAQLRAIVADYQQKLAWIREPGVRDEAEWMLGATLAERGQVQEALPMLRRLFERVGMTEVWARRSAQIARAAASSKLRDEALAYYRGAAERYKSTGAVEARASLYAEMVELLAADAGAAEIELLNQLLQEIETLGTHGKELRMHLLAYLGNVYRSNGQDDLALQYFEKALAGVDISKSPAVASAAVCYGAALLEKGEVQTAERLLRDGVSRLGDSPSDAAFLVVALRDLARLEQERGKQEKALALLYRAEGVATGRISPQSPFWLCLFDQRGWVHFSRRDYEVALTDFKQAIHQKGSDELTIQPLEGAGRCCIALGKAEDALQYLRRCLQLAQKHMAQDATSLGRINLVLGQACDMAGDIPAAASAYAEAIAKLPDSTQHNADKLYALEGLAYACTQLKQWDKAADLWQQLIALTPDDKSRQHEAKAQLARCQRHGSETTNADELSDG